MTNEVKNVPELRFPNFSEEWKKFVFKDQIISIEKGTDLLGSEDNMGIPLIKMGNIKRGYFSFNKLEKLRESETIQEKYYIKKGDFLFNTRNTMELVGKSATWTNKSGEFAFNSNIARLVLKDIDTYFFNYLYNTSKMINKVKSLAVGTTSVAAIYPRDLNHLNYFLPLIAEQEKIGEFFSKLDQQIELEEQKLEKLEEQKKGYMQKIFSQKLRFKDGNGNNYSEWIKTNLKFLVSYKNGKGYEKEVVQNGKYNIINLNSISTKGILKDSGKYSDFEDITLKKNDLIMILSDVAKGNLIGKTAIIDQDDKYLLNQRVASLRIKDESISNVLFIYYFINYFRQYFINMSTGMSQLNINKSTVEDFLIYLPYIEEQDKIGNFFSNLDKSIIKQLDKIELLKERKKGFLQKMFV